MGGGDTRRAFFSVGVCGRVGGGNRRDALNANSILRIGILTWGYVGVLV